MKLTSLSQRRRGFTIVELSVAIIVIGILATITMVVFDGIQERARDTRRVGDIMQLTKAMNEWVMRNDMLPHQSGAGYNATGGGWVYASGYAKSYETMFIEQRLIPNQIRDPQTPTGTGSYMFYRCSSSMNATYYAFLARLEHPTSAESNEYEKWIGLGCNGYGSYGMNYARILHYAG